MTRASENRFDEVLTRLMVEYDEALAANVPTKVVDESVVDFDPLLAHEWNETKWCIDLLHQARRLAADRSSHDPEKPKRPDWKSSQEIQTAGRLGRFQIKRELGRGGLGIVYLAHDPRLHRDVALKIPRFEALLDDAMRRRFLREAEAAARLSHPHLVTLLEVGEDGPLCYLTAEYCPGPTLAEWLRRGHQQPVPMNHAAALVRDLAAAIEHAHSRGVLHRDIKPSNVLLVPRSDAADTPVADQLSDLSPKLTDFGMAKLLEETNGDTRSGVIIGTVAYMSPEQAEGRVDQLDARTDVYALGALLYELLTGAAPYAGKSDMETLRQLIVSEPLTPRHVRRDVPHDLEAITLKCLAKRPSDRYATAHELVVDLKRFLAGQPTAARPLRAWERSWKWARRRPALAALATACVAGVLGMLGVATVYNARLQSALGLADSYNGRLKTALNDAEELLYSADMKLAFDAWHGDNASVLSERLERYQPAVDQPDLRTFPWHFLSRQLDGDQSDIYSHAGTVYAVAWSPRGDLIATGSADGEIRLWDVAAKKIRRTLNDHRTDVNDLAFSPDGRLLVSCGDDLALRIWDVDTNEPPRVLRTVTFSDLNGLAFSPDGHWLAAGGADQKARIWDTSSWKLVRILTAGDSAVNRVAFSADSRRLVISQSSGLGTIFDIESSEALVTLNPNENPQRRMGPVAFSHDGRLLATVSIEAQFVHFWDPESGELLKSFHCEAGWIHAMEFSPDDRQLLTGHQDGALRIWDSETLDNLHVLLGHTDDLRDIAVSPRGDFVISGSKDCLAKLWDLAAIDRRHSSLTFSSFVSAVAFHPKRNLFAFDEQFGPVRLVDAESRAVQFESDVSREDFFGTLAFSSSGEYLAYPIGHGQSVEVVDVAARKPVSHLVSTHGNFSTLAFLPDSNTIATGDDQSVFTLWDARSATKLGECNTAQGTIQAIAFFSKGQRAVVAANEEIRLWGMPTWERGALLDGASKKVDELAVSPDESLLAGASSSGEVFLWDLTSCKLRTLLVGHRGWCRSVSFSPDGKILASAGEDGTVRLWDVRTLQEVGLILDDKPRFGHLQSVTFSPDGLSLLAGGKRSDNKGVLHIWSLKGEGSPAPK